MCGGVGRDEERSCAGPAKLTLVCELEPGRPVEELAEWGDDTRRGAAPEASSISCSLARLRSRINSCFRRSSSSIRSFWSRSWTTRAVARSTTRDLERRSSPRLRTARRRSYPLPSSFRRYCSASHRISRASSWRWCITFVESLSSSVGSVADAVESVRRLRFFCRSSAACSASGSLVDPRRPVLTGT